MLGKNIPMERTQNHSFTKNIRLLLDLVYGLAHVVGAHFNEVHAVKKDLCSIITNSSTVTILSRFYSHKDRERSVMSSSHNL